MDGHSDNTNSQSTLPTPEQPAAIKERSKKTVLFIMTTILIAAGATAGYWYGHKYSQKAAQSAGSSSSSSDQSVHFVQSIGFPYDQSPSKYQFLTKLGLPSFMQGVRISSTNQNHGAEQIFTDFYNNELGRWELGTPNDSQNNGGGVSEISILAITSSWLNSTGQTDFSDYGYGSPLQTPAQKQQFLSQLESSTSSCAKDVNKGFKTKDGNLNICYTYSYGREGYGPEISLSGYGKVQEQPLVLVGSILIFDDSVDSSQDAQHQAVIDAKSGHPPAQTAEAQKATIAALEQTTVTTSLNSN